MIFAEWVILPATRRSKLLHHHCFVSFREVNSTVLDQGLDRGGFFAGVEPETAGLRGQRQLVIIIFALPGSLRQDNSGQLGDLRSNDRR